MPACNQVHSDKTQNRLPTKGKNAMSNKATLILATLVLFLSASLMRADVLYTSAAAFNAATSNPTTIDFTASCPTCFTDYATYTDAGTGTSFSIATPFINLTGMDFYGAGTYPADFLVESTTATAVANVLTVTPPGGFSAIGFNIGSFNGSTFVATLSDGAVFDITPPSYDGLGFFGFSSSGGISSISLAIPSGDTFVIDQAVLADAPEPTPLVLFATALLLFGALSRRRLTAPLR
jgi:hypothetical protein